MANLRHDRSNWAWSLVGLAPTLLICGCLQSQSDLPVAVPLQTTSSTQAVSASETLPAPATGSIAYRHDFGAVIAGQDLVHEFSVTNRSGQEWFVEHVDSTCGCTTARLSKSRIASGEVLLLPVRLAARNAGNTTKPTRQRVTLKLKNGLPPLFLDVTALIRPLIQVNPPAVSQTLIPDSQTSVELTVENFMESGWSGISLTPTAADDCSDWFRPGSPRLIEEPGAPGQARQRWALPISLESTRMPPGELTVYLELTPQVAGVSDATGQAAAKVKIPFKLSVLQPVKAVPESLFCSITRPAESISRPLLFVFATPEFANSTPEIRTDSKLPCQVSLKAAVTASKTESVRTYQLVVTPSAALQGTVRDRIVVSFGPPLNTSIEVPITLHRSSSDLGDGG